MAVHRLGHMNQQPPPYRELVAQLPEDLVDALDAHISRDLHEEADSAHRDAVLALALRDHLDHWPDRPPAQSAPLEHVALDRDLVTAVAWCRLGGRLGRPSNDAAFSRAKALGLLAQDDVWRATAAGEGLLIAAGLLDGAPAAERAAIHVLWARSQRYPRPQFVRAWSDGFVETWRRAYDEQRAAAQIGFEHDIDFGPWTFWTTAEYLDLPKARA